jgi:hypothetical protein
MSAIYIEDAVLLRNMVLLSIEQRGNDSNNTCNAYLERDEAVVAEVEALQVLEVPQARHLRTHDTARQQD